MTFEKQDDLDLADNETVSVARSIQAADRRYIQPGELPLEWEECLEMAKERFAART